MEKHESTDHENLEYEIDNFYNKELNNDFRKKIISTYKNEESRYE
jgi:hypothetical protein